MPAIRHLFVPPDDAAAPVVRRPDGEDEGLCRRRKGLLTQAWTAFGMDAAVWLTGTQGP